MNNNNTPSQPTKTYINGNWIREKIFDDGGSILTVSILPERFIESIQDLKPDENGFIRLVIAKKRTPDEKSSHYMYLDTWKQSTPKPSVAPIKSISKPKKTIPVEVVDDDSAF